MNVACPDDVYDDDMNQELQAYEQQREWKKQFIALGGFTHLLQCII